VEAFLSGCAKGNYQRSYLSIWSKAFSGCLREALRLAVLMTRRLVFEESELSLPGWQGLGAAHKGSLLVDIAAIPYLHDFMIPWADWPCLGFTHLVTVYRQSYHDAA
jgi:hypothetical protein